MAQGTRYERKLVPGGYGRRGSTPRLGISIKFNDAMFHKLDGLAVQRGISFSKLVRRIVNVWDHGTET